MRFLRTVLFCAFVFETGRAGPPLVENTKTETIPNFYVLDPVDITIAEDEIGHNYFSTKTTGKAFFDLERKLIAAVSQSPTHSLNYQAISDLARFYIAHELYFEASAILKDVDFEVAPRSLAALASICDLQTARDRSALERLSFDNTNSTERALQIIALVRQGAYKKALKQAVIPDTSLEVALNRDYRSALLEAAVFAGDRPITDRLLRETRDFRDEITDFEFLAAQSLEGEEQDARLQELSRLPHGSASIRSEIKILDRELKNNLVASNILAQRVHAIRLRWRGGVVEREMLSVLAEVNIAIGDFEQALRAFKKLINEYPLSDSAFTAQGRITEILPNVVNSDFGLMPNVAAELVLEYSEFAPIGARGDALIRDLADKLSALELNTEAAKLLNHQVFERLRGADRSVVATDLADLYLRDENPSDALAVLRSTRIAGLAPDINSRRRVLEAEALVSLGKMPNALALLATPKSNDEIHVRAKIFWKMEDWPNAAREYASLFSVVSQPDPMLAVRAAVSYQLADDMDGFNGFMKTASLVLKDAPELALLQGLRTITTPDPAFLNAYESVFQVSDGHS